MTWDEFVAVVNQKLADAGLNGSEPIWYVDVTFPYIADRIKIEKGEGNLGIAIME